MGVAFNTAPRSIVAVIFFSLFLASCGSGDGGATPGPSPPPTQRPLPPPGSPNVLFIIADDLRPEIGAYGAPLVQTPNIDAFASTAALFERSYVSISLCAPSRFAMFTGLRPDTSGLVSNDKPLDDVNPSLTTMVDQFRNAGFETESIGKVYHHKNDDAKGWDFQFRLPEIYYDKSAGATTDTSRLVDSQYAAKAIERMRALKTDGRPFFLAVGFNRPHMPFLAPPQDWAIYTKGNLPAPRPPQTGAPGWALYTDENYLYADLYSYTKDKYLPPNFPQDVNDNLTLGYLASVSYVDSLIGNVLSQLQALDLDKSTIVVVWGDNGYKLNDYGFWSKGSNSDIDNRVPLLIRAPGHSRAGSKINGIVEAIDLYPTLAELAGLSPRSELEGQSFVRLLDQPASSWKTAAFDGIGMDTSDGPKWGFTVTTERYRYTAWVAPGQLVTQELYDHETDPEELMNVAQDPAYANVRAHMEAIRTSGGTAVRAELRSRLGTN